MNNSATIRIWKQQHAALQTILLEFFRNVYKQDNHSKKLIIKTMPNDLNSRYYLKPLRNVAITHAACKSDDHSQFDGAIFWPLVDRRR
jgi:hypothetical protein